MGQAIATSRRLRVRYFAATSAIGLLLAMGNLANAVVVRTVALTGEQAPGMPTGALFNGFFSSQPAIDMYGRVAFRGFVSGGGVSLDDNSGIWSESTGALNLIAREGAPAPGASDGALFRLFRGPNVNASGQIAFYDSLIDTTDRFSIWSNAGGSLEFVVRQGMPAPGTPAGVSFEEVSTEPVFNSAGAIAFDAMLTGSGTNPSNDRGIWSNASGALALVARSGSAAAGTGTGVNYNTFNPPVLNAAGRTAFRASLTGTGVDSTNDDGIWSEASGALGLIVRAGSPAPGTSLGVNFGSVGLPKLNDAGQTVFLGTLTGSGINSTNDEGFWLETSGNLDLVVRKGDPAPGTAPGVVFNDFISHPVLNTTGKIAFNGRLSGTGVDNQNYTGIWAGGLDGLELIARHGDPVPGAPDGIKFEFIDDFVLNSAGQTAFVASLYPFPEPKTGEANNGLFATNRQGELQVIARSGDVIEVAPSDFRTVNALGFLGGTGNEDGRPTGFNDFGQIAFVAEFTDGSAGIFVSNLVALPEPASLSLFVVAISVGLRVRRRVPGATAGSPSSAIAAGALRSTVRFRSSSHLQAQGDREALLTS